ncbi:hypothetical protein FRB96_004078 [Tulasnella sp. 330]|nr:hypothetical protein FRB96_004078 [Tulasnella sp. 330]
MAISLVAGQTLPGRETLDSIEHLAKTLAEIANDLRTIKADISFRKIWTAVKTVLTYQAVQDQISNWSSKLGWAMRFFQIEPLAPADLDRVQNHLELREDIKEVAGMSVPIPSLAGTNLLEQNLRPAPARYNSSIRDTISGGVGGTHVTILQMIHLRIFGTSSETPQIFWPHRLPGTGKSTIAQTISGYSAATLERVSSSRLKQIEPTDDGFSELSPINSLILSPASAYLEVIYAPSPVVLVLDALDECNDPTLSTSIVTLLVKASSALPPCFRLRILITSRPEAHLNASFTQSFAPVISNIIALEDIEASIDETDILDRGPTLPESPYKVTALTACAWANDGEDYIRIFWQEPAGDVRQTSHVSSTASDATSVAVTIGGDDVAVNRPLVAVALQNGKQKVSINGGATWRTSSIDTHYIRAAIFSKLAACYWDPLPASGAEGQVRPYYRYIETAPRDLHNRDPSRLGGEWKSGQIFAHPKLIRKVRSVASSSSEHPKWAAILCQNEDGGIL